MGLMWAWAAHSNPSGDDAGPPSDRTSNTKALDLAYNCLNHMSLFKILNIPHMFI